MYRNVNAAHSYIGELTYILPVLRSSRRFVVFNLVVTILYKRFQLS